LISNNLLHLQDIESEVMAIHEEGAKLPSLGHGLRLHSQGLRVLEKVRLGIAHDAFEIEKLRDAALNHGLEQHSGSLAGGPRLEAFLGNVENAIDDEAKALIFVGVDDHMERVGSS